MFGATTSACIDPSRRKQTISLVRGSVCRLGDGWPGRLRYKALSQPRLFVHVGLEDIAHEAAGDALIDGTTDVGFGLGVSRCPLVRNDQRTLICLCSPFPVQSS